MWTVLSRHLSSRWSTGHRGAGACGRQVMYILTCKMNIRIRLDMDMYGLFVTCEFTDDADQMSWRKRVLISTSRMLPRPYLFQDNNMKNGIWSHSKMFVQGASVKRRYAVGCLVWNNAPCLRGIGPLFRSQLCWEPEW